MVACLNICLSVVESSCRSCPGMEPTKSKLTGQTQEISMFLHLAFYEPVYYHFSSDTFPSASNEEQGWWVIVAIHVDDGDDADRYSPTMRFLIT
jgi:hypothetical protein